MTPEAVLQAVRKTRKIKGWFNPGAAYLFAFLDEIQKREGYSGNIFEIGVHYGRSTVILAMMIDRQRERLGVCDVFDRGGENISESGYGDRVIFETNLDSFFPGMDFIDVYEKSSRDLTIGEVTSACRLFHIDGGHSVDETYSDLSLASEAILPGGIIIMDDVFSPLWPGVVDGFFRFVSERPAHLTPLVIGFNKLVLVSPGMRDSYLKYLDDAEQCNRAFSGIPYTTLSRSFLGYSVRIFHTTHWAVSDSLRLRTYSFFQRHSWLENPLTRFMNRMARRITGT